MSKASTILLILSICLLMTPGNSAQSQTMQTVSDISVVINFGNGTVLSFEGVVADTVYNATCAVVSVEEEWYGDLVFITSIAGVANNPSKDRWWQYWVDGELGPVAANKYYLADGNVIEWRLSSQNTTANTSQTIEMGNDPSLVIGTVTTGALGLGFLVILSVRRRIQ